MIIKEIILDNNAVYKDVEINLTEEMLLDTIEDKKIVYLKKDNRNIFVDSSRIVSFEL